MKFIIQIYEGEINGHGEREGLPTEYQYDFEQEMLSMFMISRMISERNNEVKDYQKMSHRL